MYTVLSKDEHVDKEFNGIDLSNQDLINYNFYSIKFVNCSFQSAQLQESSFENCTFKNCNLSLVKTRGTRFFDSAFVNCKLLGINFGECNKIFKASFKDSLILDSNFIEMSLQGTVFKNSRFNGSYFTNSNLSKAKFIECDLSNCIFQNTALNKTDFSSSFNYFISDKSNDLSGAIFSLPEAASLLYNFNIKII